jgi:Protein of unknown function (DUF2892)
MKENVGTIDLVVRSVLGVGILAYLAKDGVFHPGSIPGIVVAAILIATAVLRYCPLYQLLGFTTSNPRDRAA